jgi:catechol 2,3-dioxygenase-like lactoylglutathione lyase family enzyme
MTSPQLFLVELVVADWSRSEGWYQLLLQSPPVLRDETNRFTLFAPGGVKLALKEGTADPGQSRIVFEVADLAAQMSRLAASGIEPEGEVKASPEGYVRVFFRDPDGHRVGLFQWLRSLG